MHSAAREYRREGHLSPAHTCLIQRGTVSRAIAEDIQEKKTPGPAEDLKWTLFRLFVVLKKFMVNDCYVEACAYST